MQETVAHIGRQIFESNVRGCLEMIDDSHESAAQISGTSLVGIAHERKLLGRFPGVGDQLGRVNFQDRSQAMTVTTGAVGGIERERARLEWRHVDAAVHARHLFRVQLLFAVDDRNQNRAASQL